MAEYSYPVEEEPMPSSLWPSVTKGIGNGILDQGGFPYRLKSLDNATNKGVLQAATNQAGDTFSAAILEGFYHKLDSDMVLDFPAVTKRTTYYVVIEFDPIRGTEQGVPVKARAIPGALNYTGGKNYLHLYNVTREPNQLLTDASVRMIRPRVAPVQVYAAEADLPQAHKVLWGTLAVVHGGRNTERTKIFMSMNTNASGEDAEDSWFWKLIYEQKPEPSWTTVGDTTNAQSGSSGYSKEILRDGSVRRLRGRVNRGSSGTNYVPNADSGYLFMNLGSGDVPSAGSHRWAYGGGRTLVDVEISRANAEVRFWVTGTCSYVDLDVEWTV